MKTTKKTRADGITRRDMLKVSGLALAGLAVAGTAEKALAAASDIPLEEVPVAIEKPPAKGTMRITFCGTWYTPRPHQASNSIFVELGNVQNDGDWGDSFVFDCGSGTVANYVALGVPYSRMTQVFLTHLHGDHMSDITTIYCFGPASDRKTPLHVYGPSRGYLLDTDPYKPGQPGTTEGEGTKDFVAQLLELTKWHRNSFSFLPTGYVGQPVHDGVPEDGYWITPHELDYMKNPGSAYDGVGADGKPVTITHFPAIHAREGAISYRLDWNGMSMIFSGDTKPNTYVIQNAKGDHGQGVDVLIHEIASHPSVWVTNTSGLQPGDPDYYKVLALNVEVIENSHTVGAAFGYIMSQAQPRLAVGTHMQNDPNLRPAVLRDVRCSYKGPMIFADDLLVITAAKNHRGETTFKQGPAHVPPYPWTHSRPFTGTPADAKFDGPLAQFSNTLLEAMIPIEVYEKCIAEPRK
jgi:ribonuclease Z